MGNVGSGSSGPLFDADAVPDDSLILRVWYQRATNLSNALGGDLDGLADPYVKLYLTREHEELGDQGQQTSIKKDTLDPEWTPPEMFAFMIPPDWDLTRVSLVCEVMDYDRVGADDSLGNSILCLRDVGLGEEMDEKILPILHPKTNTDTQGTSVIGVDLVSKAMAFATDEHVLIEYQRWQAGGWGSKRPGHFLPTDPVDRWGTVDGSFTDQEFDTAVAHAFPTLKENHVIEKDWHYVQHEGSHDGWAYATFFRARVWSDVKSWKHTCRRRFWRRTTIDRAVRDSGSSGAGAATQEERASRDDVLGALGKSLLASQLSAAADGMAQ